MRNFVQPGHVVMFTAPTGGVSSGDGVQIGQLFVVAANDASANQPFEGQVVGVFRLPKANGQAWTEGALVFWDDSTGEVTTTAIGNLLIGCAAAVAAADATVGIVRLNGSARANEA